MDFTGRRMTGYVYVDAEGLCTGAQLRFWLERCEDSVAALLRKPRK